MALPAHTDRRADRFFVRQYVGRGRGDNGSDYVIAWDSTSGATPTTLYSTEGGHVNFCAYCGNTPYPIQEDVGDPVIGHACVCKDAMDEVKWVSEYNAMLMRHSEEKEQLEKRAPKPNPTIAVRVVKACANKIIEEVEKGWGQQGLKNLGIHHSNPISRLKD